LFLRVESLKNHYWGRSAGGALMSTGGCARTLFLGKVEQAGISADDKSLDSQQVTVTEGTTVDFDIGSLKREL